MMNYGQSKGLVQIND